MVHFVTDQSAKGVLRSLVRQVAQDTPSMAELRRQTTMAMTTPSSLKAMARMKEILEPFAFDMRVTRLSSGHMLRANLIRFHEDNADWTLTIDQLEATCDRKNPHVDYFITDITFSGHALGRLFQRAAVISKPDVFSELRCAVSYLHYWYAAVPLGLHPLQVVCPTEKGVFVGQVTYDQPDPKTKKGKFQMAIKTFLPDGKERFDRLKGLMLAMEYEVGRRMPPSAWTEQDYLRAYVSTGKVMCSIITTDAPWVLEPYTISE